MLVERLEEEEKWRVTYRSAAYFTTDLEAEGAIRIILASNGVPLPVDEELDKRIAVSKRFGQWVVPLGMHAMRRG